LIEVCLDGIVEILSKGTDSSTDPRVLLLGWDEAYNSSLSGEEAGDRSAELETGSRHLTTSSLVSSSQVHILFNVSSIN
jgi:hypothetical protein